MNKTIIVMLLVLVLSFNFASAVVVNSVQVDTLRPGAEGNIAIEVENIFDEDVVEVSMNLHFTNLPFIPIGTSEKSAEEIRDGRSKEFLFRIKAANDITPADYEIPYTIQYKVEDVEGINVREGTIGLRVTGNSDLVYSVTADNAIVKENGKITFKIVNKGYTDARFVTVKIVPTNFVLLSEKEVYIGTVDSDDFETVSFNVVFQGTETNFQALVEYKDFNNKDVVKSVILPLTVYSKEEALELGIIKPNKSKSFFAGLVLLVVGIIVYRTIKKRKRLKRSKERKEK